MNQDMPIPTMRVKFDNEHGFCIINKDDFDASKHEAFDASEAPAPKQEAQQDQADQAQTDEGAESVVKQPWQS